MAGLHELTSELVNNRGSLVFISDGWSFVLYRTIVDNFYLRKLIDFALELIARNPQLPSIRNVLL